MMNRFDQAYEGWLQLNISQEKNPRRLELLEKGLGYGTIEFLRQIWFPAVGNLDHLYPEWEVRDFSNRYRYLDLAYMPGGAKGGIEIQAETVRFSRRLLRPYTPMELAAHLKITDRHVRRVLSGLVDRQILYVTSGKIRYRTYQIRQ